MPLPLTDLMSTCRCRRTATGAGNALAFTTGFGGLKGGPGGMGGGGHGRGKAGLAGSGKSGRAACTGCFADSVFALGRGDGDVDSECDGADSTTFCVAACGWSCTRGW